MKLPKHIKGAIFDLDGTLLNSLHVWQDVDRRFFQMHALPLPDDYYRAIKAMELKEAAIYTKTRFSLPESVEEMVGIWHGMVREEYALRVELKPHAKELLELLFSRGVKLGIATSSAREIFLPCLKRHGIEQYFTSFTETREAKRGKNFPDPYLLAAKRLKLSPEDCAVFEDISVGIKSAKTAGFFTVALSDPNCPDEEEALKTYSDLFIRDFLELLIV